MATCKDYPTTTLPGSSDHVGGEDGIGHEITMPDTSTSTLTVDTLNLFDAYMQTATGEKSLYMFAIGKIEAIEVNDIAIEDDEFSESERSKLIAEMSVSIVDGLTRSAMSVAQKTIQNQRDSELKYENMIAEKDAILAAATKIEAENLYAKEYGLIAKQKADAGMRSSVASCRITTTDKNIRYTSTNVHTILGHEKTINDVAYNNAAIVDVKTNELTREKTRINTYGAELDRISTQAKVAYTKMKDVAENGSGYVLGANYSGSGGTITLGLDGVNLVNGSYLSVQSNGTWASTWQSTTPDHSYDYGLTYWQTKVQEETEKTFDYNMWQHAANSSANMVATAVAAAGWDKVSEVSNRWKDVVENKLMSKKTVSTNKDCPHG